MVARPTIELDANRRCAATERAASRSAAVDAAPGRGDAQTLRIAASKVDQLINLIGELVIVQSALTEAVQDFSMAKLPRLREAVAEMGRAGRELQERVMAVRMLPIKVAFGRFPRLVHDLSVACGKQVELRNKAERLDLDRKLGRYDNFKLMLELLVT